MRERHRHCVSRHPAPQPSPTSGAGADRVRRSTVGHIRLLCPLQRYTKFLDLYYVTIRRSETLRDEIAIAFALAHHLLAIGVQCFVDDPLGGIDCVIVLVTEMAKPLG